MIFLSGCEGKNIQEDHPIAGPIPPRTTLEVQDEYYASDTDESAAEPGHHSRGVKAIPASYSHDRVLDPKLNGSEVVATINGEPVFADDVLQGFGSRLAEAEKQLPPDKFHAAKKELIRRHLPEVIDRILVLQDVKKTLLPEQMESIQSQLDVGFRKYTEHLADQMKVASAVEVDEKLRAEGASLSRLRKMFGEQQIARQFLETKAVVKKEVGRSELLKYYNAHIEDYSAPAEVKWQQIVVRFAKHSDKEAAKETMRKAWVAIRKGAPFEDVARKYSDGVSADEGGRWGWIQKGSLADSEIENILFELKKGEVSDLFVRDDRFELVRVEDKRDATTKSFSDVQFEIEKKLLADAEKDARAKVLKDLRADARIKTIFDAPEKKKADPEILRVSHSP